MNSEVWDRRLRALTSVETVSLRERLNVCGDGRKLEPWHQSLMRWYNREVQNVKSDLDLSSALPCSSPLVISSLVTISVVNGDPKRSHFLKLCQPVSQLTWNRRDNRPR